jgi:hypothetical protein
MTADLAGLFAAPPPGPAQPVTYRQGVIVSFDPATLANTVNVGGTVLADLPILGVGEASLLIPGSVVGIMVMGDAGAKSMAIIGRWVRPNTPEATEAIGLLNSLVFAATVTAQESRTADTYGDLATVGPQVTARVRPSGRLLVVITSQIQFSEAGTPTPQRGGFVSVALSGANTVTADDAADIVLAAMNVGIVGAVGAINQLVAQGSYTAAGVFEGLTPGDTTVTMKYASQYSGEQMDFGKRNLIAVAL